LGEKIQVAGWGVIVFRYDGPDDISANPEFILHAPVVTQEWDHRWIGAREATNNTGELSAIGEAMLWLTHEAPDDGSIPVTIRFDSYYAANMARGIWVPRANEELAVMVRDMTAQVQSRRSINWQHVYGHRGYHDNELADVAADLGRQGKVSEMSKRWAAPPPVIANTDEPNTDTCRKCGTVLLTRDIAWHVQHCDVDEANWLAPANFSKCRKCQIWVNFRRSHEPKCRGSALLNRTCGKCGKVFPEPPPEMHICRAMRNHEIWCKGGTGAPGGGEAGDMAAQEEGQAPAAKAGAKAKAAAKAGVGAAGAGKAQAKAKAKAKAGAKAKAKAKAGAKAKAKAKAEAKGKAAAKAKAAG